MSNVPQLLSGKVALVTGAGGDLGRGIALRLHASGARVMVADYNRERALQTAGLIDQGDEFVFDADITDSTAVQKMIVKIKDQHAPVDILVNNAGDIRDALLTEMTEDDWDYVIDLNLKGAFLCARAVAPSMTESRFGRIINISSMAYKGNVGQVNYASAKAGIVGMTRSLGLELARFGIAVNCVAPGIIDTPKAGTLPEKVRERLIKLTPMRRMGQIEDIANAVHFFASDQSGYVTRQVLHVSGGMEGF
ncbi:MAG: 3-oxoacyl-ACP reductase FabG [Arenicellales bacterium]|jgi:3-oxoacyl-[acyl-carrier protein] reductase|nr:3-oxoacyl-ACP reductase FabG [Arenicellales bacterium]MDP7452619.1 3-oxoacyl-ACP reductase FabG [Arenicellales bacterium]|tara:strand:+ start:10640 stop:11389 length:750 start_codon:yes stop_codon:yes gene_type:complete